MGLDIPYPEIWKTFPTLGSRDKDGMDDPLKLWTAAAAWDRRFSQGDGASLQASKVDSP